MLLRAQAIDSQGRWSRRLGDLYYEIIMGSNAATLGGAIRSSSPAEANSPYAQNIRKKLADSTDVELLVATARRLILSQAKTDFDQRVLGRSYLARALKLNPQFIQARALLHNVDAGDRYHRMRQTLRAVPKASESQVVSNMTEAERFAHLPQLAEHGYMWGEHLEYTKRDEAGAKAEWARAKKYAEDALTLAPRFRSDRNYGTAIYKANMTLGLLAFRDGNQKEAVRYLLTASKAPASAELTYSQGIAAARLNKYLLKHGERDSVIEFLERMAQTNIPERGYLLESAAAIRNGRMPVWYQRTMTRPSPTKN